MELTRINNYTFAKPLASDNSGFSKWGIGTRDGRKYFVKEFLSPVYPADDSVFSEKRKQDRICLCEHFVGEKLALYETLRSIRDGHIVAVEQFFRVGAKYYMSTKAITDQTLSIEQIAASSFLERLRLCCTVAYSMSRVHDNRIVHADIKPDNILVIRKVGLRPYIIDFDCSFFEENCPGPGEELNGDLVYLSPEAFLHIAEIESNLSCKMDVFALGLLFCQYLTGSLPDFDTEEYQYAYESVLDGNALGLDRVLNVTCRQLLSRMLQRNPDDRPEMSEVFTALNEMLLAGLRRTPPQEVEPEPEPDPMPKRVTKPKTVSNGFFQVGGDLL